MPDMDTVSPSTHVGSPSTFLESPSTVTGSPGTMLGDDDEQDREKSVKPDTVPQASFQSRSSRAEKVDDEEVDDLEDDDTRVFKAPKLIPLVPSRAHEVKPINYRRNSRGIHKLYVCQSGGIPDRRWSISIQRRAKTSGKTKAADKNFLDRTTTNTSPPLEPTNFNTDPQSSSERDLDAF